MAATSTLRQVLIELAERYGFGIVTLCTGTTTTLTLTTTGSPELRGPRSGAAIPVMTPVIVTAGGTVGERTYVSNWVPSTGVITVSPAITTGATEVILYLKDVNDSDRTPEAVNRASLNRVFRMQKVPLTFVPGGDMLGTTASDHWTASAGTASYVETSFPEVSGRVLNLAHSSTASVSSNSIPVRGGEQWEFVTAIRATSSGDTATLTAETVDGPLTVSYSVGDGAVSHNAFYTQRGTFTIPGTEDDQASLFFKLDLSGSGSTSGQMAPIVAYPKDARTFPMSNRIESTTDIGNFFYKRGWGSSAGPEEGTYTEPITMGGLTHTFSEAGDHLNVSFNFAPCGPIYYDERIYGPSLASMTTTTTFPLDRMVKWTAFELYDRLMRDEMHAGQKAENGSLLPSKYRQLRNAALRAAEATDPAGWNIVGRR